MVTKLGQFTKMGHLGFLNCPNFVTMFCQVLKMEIIFFDIPSMTFKCILDLEVCHMQNPGVFACNPALTDVMSKGRMADWQSLPYVGLTTQLLQGTSN